MAIVIPILTEFSGKGIAKAKAEFQQLEGFGAKAGFVLKKSMVPIAGLLAGVGTAAFQAGQELLGMAQAAAEDEKQQAQLAQTLKQFTKATDAQVAAVEDYIDKTARATGVADDKLRPAFNRLARSTKGVDDAQRLLNLALDIAATTNKPLLTISDALAKSYDGQDGALARLGVGLDKTKLKVMNFEEQTKFMEDRFRGGASTAADTFQGKMDRLRYAFNEFKESIGKKLLDKLTVLAEKMLVVVDAFNENGLSGALRALKTELPEVNRLLGITYDTLRVIYQAGQGAKFLGQTIGRTAGAVFGNVGASLRGDMDYEMKFLGDRPQLLPSYNEILNRGLPRVVNVPTSEFVGPVANRDTRTGSTVRIDQVNITTGADPKSVVDALVKWNRQNGGIPISIGRR